MEKLRLMIVEDEANIRLCLQEVINWDTLGYVVVSVCANGRQAIGFLENNECDVVLSDIVMPLVDGLELARWIRSNRQEIRIVFLSGYDDFQYAKKALETGVNHYILKPMDINIINQVFADLCPAIEYEKKVRQEQRLMESRKYRLILALVAQSLKQCLMQGHIDVASSQSFSDLSENDHGGFPDTVGLVKIRTRPAAPKASQENLPERRTAAVGKEQAASVKQQLPAAEFPEFMQMLNSSTDPYFAVPIQQKDGSVNIYLVSRNLSATPQASKNHIIANFNNRIKTLEQLFGNAYDIVGQQWFDDWQAFERYIEESRSMPAASDSQESQTTMPKSYSEVIQAVRLIIRENFASEITIEKLADTVHLNPDYLSRLFKKEAQVSITEYMIRTRMERAAELLADRSNKVYQVARLVGYRDVRHFYQVFQKHFGVTPHNYRHQIKAGE